MNEICPICFCTDGNHQEWCPNNPKNIDVPEFLMGLFNPKDKAE